MDRYPYHWYTILLRATGALAHIGVHFTHHVFGLSTSSRMPSGCVIDLSVIYNVISIGVSSPKLSLCTTDRGIKFILPPKSHKAFLNSYFPMEQGMVKLPGSFIFAGSFYCIMALQVAVKFTIPSSAIFLFLFSISFRNFS